VRSACQCRRAQRAVTRAADAGPDHGLLAALELAMQDKPAGTLLARQDSDEAVKRREFLTSLASAAGIGGLQASMLLEGIRHDVSLSLEDVSAGPDRGEWHEIMLEYGELYQHSAPAEVLRRLIVDIHQVQAALRRNPGDARIRELRLASAYLAAFMAMTVANLGYAQDSHRWWRTARRAADACGEPSSALWIRSREIIQAWYGNRPMSSVLRLLDDAEARTGKHAPPAVMSEFLSSKAQIMAVIGPSHAGQAEKSLAKLRESFATIPGTSAGQRHDSLFHYSEDCLRYTESLVYIYLGDFGKADASQAIARKLYALNYQRGTVQIELHSALCLVRAGDITSGISHAHKILSDVPAECRVESVADLSRKIIDAVPGSQKRRPAVQAYRDRLVSSFAI
jgi:hypothetical protein